MLIITKNRSTGPSYTILPPRGIFDGTFTVMGILSVGDITAGEYLSMSDTGEGEWL